MTTQKTNIDGRAFSSRANGFKGGRPKGSGLTKDEAKASLMEMIKNHAFEEITVTFGGKTTTKARVLIAIEALFEIGLKKQQPDALDKYLNRILGLPKQAVDVTSNGETLKLDL